MGKRKEHNEAKGTKVRGKKTQQEEEKERGEGRVGGWEE